MTPDVRQPWVVFVIQKMEVFVLCFVVLSEGEDNTVLKQVFVLNLGV